MPTHEILVDSERKFHAISAAYNKDNDDPSQTEGRKISSPQHQSTNQSLLEFVIH